MKIMSFYQVIKKKDILSYTSDSVINSMVVKPGVSKANYIPALSGELKASI